MDTALWVQRLGKLLDVRLFAIGGTTVTVATLLSALLVLLATYWLSRLARKALTRAMEKRGVRDEGSIRAATRLVQYAVIVTGIAVAVQTLGVNLSALFAAGALFAVGIGFATRNIAENFVAGIILLVERSIKPGDILEIDGKVVRVLRMGIRATFVRTQDDEKLIVPNSILVSATVKNFTLFDSACRVRARVGVAYSSDLEQVRQVLEAVASGFGGRAPEPTPRVTLLRFGDSSIEYDVSVWIDDPWEAPAIGSRLNEAVCGALRRAGVTIAFPQLDVHFDPPVLDSLKRVAKAA